MNHMRQGQNSKRSRGRGRKPQNSSNRAYDSNGPDVKIRGTAAHVCEKYQQLARDAISAGDRVMAENYYQHAEHYYRLLMATQTVNEGQARPQNNLGYRPDEDEEEEEDFALQPQPQHPHQPYHQQAQPFGGHQGNGMNGSGRGQTGFEDGDGKEQPSEQPGARNEFQGQASGPQGGAEGPRRRQGRRRRPRHEGGGERNETAAPASAESADGTPA